MFPALCQLYETAVETLSEDQACELDQLIERQKVCCLLVACLIIY